MEEETRNLTSQLRSGDSNAFNHFYRSYHQRLLKFAYSYLRDEFIAGNIVQDAFMALWENREKLDPGVNLPAYLLTIVKNKSLNYLQRETIKTKVVGKVKSQAVRELELRCSTLEACNPEQMFHTDVQDIIKKTLESLSPQCRNVMELSRFEGLANKEIAEKLGITTKAVEFHITKALKLFRTNLKDYMVYILLFFKYL